MIAKCFTRLVWVAAFLWVWAGPLFGGRTTTVPKRMQALKRHWGGGTESGADLWGFLIGLGIVLVVGGAVSAWVLYLVRKSRKARITEELANKAGLSRKEMQLLQRMASSIKKAEPYEMLVSVSGFDRLVGLFLRGYCKRNAEPAALVSLLSSIRKKLSKTRPMPAAGLPGLGRISLLSRVDAWNVSRRGSELLNCRVVERQANHLRLIGWTENRAEAWQKGDALRIRTTSGDYIDTEILVNFRGVELKSSGLFYADYDFSCTPAEKSGISKEINLPVKVGTSLSGAEAGILTGLGGDWAQINSPEPFHAGDGVRLFSDLDPTAGDDGTPGTVIYSCKLPEEDIHKIGLRFEKALTMNNAMVVAGMKSSGKRG